MSTSSSSSRLQALGGSLTHGSFTNRVRKPTELMLVPMIDIFTVLVTFLLMTAVFSRITILQLDLPSADSAGAPSPPEFRLEVIVRESGFELTNGDTLIAAVPKVNGEYDYKMLTDLALQLKREYPDVDDASVLLERQVKYDYLIQVMDAIRSVQQDGSKLELFTNVAVGEAPEEVPTAEQPVAEGVAQ
ncbi:MAG: biopolymer transporter ExbD [Steroidobacter sp.]